MNANLTISTKHGDRQALVTSSLVGKCAPVMPATAVAGVWLAGNVGTQYGPESTGATGNQNVRSSLFGTTQSRITHSINALGYDRKRSIRRLNKPRVANA